MRVNDFDEIGSAKVRAVIKNFFLNGFYTTTALIMRLECTWIEDDHVLRYKFKTLGTFIIVKVPMSQS